MEKEFISTQKYLVMSPRKIRVVADLVKKLRPQQAIEKLEFIRRRSAEPLIKVIKTAIAQAKMAGVSDTDLVLKEIQIGEGPRLPRGRPVSRGQWHPYKKRMSHIRVVLTTLNKQMPNAKSQINTNSKNSKSKTGAKTVKK